jgi:hypothetical protein
MSTTFTVPIANRLTAQPLGQDGKWTADWMRFWPGFNGPAVLTLTLAKLTPAGTQGSISINAYGLVTEIVPAT